MVNIVDPLQNELFDAYSNMLSPVAHKRLMKSWPGIFRHMILTEMPVEDLRTHFDPVMGRPSTELYSIAGLLLIMEFKNWTVEEAADAYMFSMDVQYALNLGRDNQSMTTRTVERYQRLFREEGFAAKIMDRVSGALVDALDLNIEKQRLDSTHVFSNMATFTRTRMMGVTIKRFLVQLKRHHKEDFEVLDEELRERYSRSEAGLFGDVSKKEDARRLLKQQVAEDLYALIERFAQDKAVCAQTSYKNMVKVFGQQCDVADKNVTVKKKTGGDVIQNPSDPDATYDGHKGPGYQVQLSETCSEENDVQLITSAMVETACDSDSAALVKVVDDLERNDLLPKEMTADTHYGSDGNVQYSHDKEVDLISPVSGPAPEKDPAQPTEKQQRLQDRRKEQETDEWKKGYRIRAGIEGTNSAIKRKTGLDRLRVRGMSSMSYAILMKIAGWNILCAARSKKLKGTFEERRRKNLLSGILSGCHAHILAHVAVWKVQNVIWLRFFRSQQVRLYFSRLPANV